MKDIDVEIVGDSSEIPVDVAPDRHLYPRARRRWRLQEDASVMPNRKARTMTWRAEIRTPGLPPGTRRLGDLRLECEVGMVAAALISDHPRSRLGALYGLLRKCKILRRRPLRPTSFSPSGRSSASR